LSARPIRNFLKAVWEPFTIAFATTSSESALPKAMEVMQRLGVPKRIVSFVMPAGYSFNLDGSTLYLAWLRYCRSGGGGDNPPPFRFGEQLAMMLTQ